MGYYVHLSVIFAADKNEGVAELAKRHLEKNGVTIPKSIDHWPMPHYGDEQYNPDEGHIPSECELSKEAAWFLSDLSKRTGGNPGPKGGLSMWGIVGNYTDANDFVDSLKEFWFDLLSEKADGGPFSFEHVIVFCEPEQREYASCHEIYLNEDKRSNYKPEDLVIKHHKPLPFGWKQM